MGMRMFSLRFSHQKGHQHDTLDARECLSALKQRLGKFGLKVHPEKTRLVRFGRFALSHYREDQGKPGTFDFLGFTHYVGQNRAGSTVVMRKTKRR